MRPSAGDLPQFNQKAKPLKFETIRSGDTIMVMQTGGYDRTILYRSPDGVDGPHGIEIVRFVWPPGSRTPNHDHSATGTVIVLEGALYEKKAGRTARITAGDVLVEVGMDVPHIVGNDGAEPAVSIHTYFTRQLRMNEYPDPPSTD
jgi:quercetin dioxygenase-like cupin family protein